MKRFVVLLLLGAVICAGCQQHGPKHGGQPIVNPGPLPTYQAVVDGYNQRVANLDRLWTYTSVRFWFTDDQGKEHTEVLDANLQIILPSRLLLRLDKVNNTVALLGSNDEKYWWIELGDQPRALWGSHSAVSAARLAQISGVGGLPVHPLDVIDLLGITPLPGAEHGVGVGDEATLAWSPDGRSLLVTASGRGGRRRLWLDPKTFEASRVELLGGGDEGGPNVVAFSELSAYVPVKERMGVESPLLASQIMLNLPDARVKLVISDPENTNGHPKPDVFDLDRLVSQYRVRDIRCVDDPAKDPGH